MLTAEQVNEFREVGFLVVSDVLDSSDVDPVYEEYEQALAVAAERLAGLGLITSTYPGRPFAERYMSLLAENPAVFYYLGISLPLDYEELDPEYVRVHTGPALFGLMRHQRILDVVESVIGPEIALNPILQVRLKPPERTLQGPMTTYSNVGATTWHQDSGAAMEDAMDTDMVTVWVAMTDASEEMGCLVAIPESHRPQELTLHCPGIANPAENYIPQALLDRHDRPPVPLPCRRGSLVLLSKYTEHAALPNVSDRLRWSFDLRYQPSGQPSGRPAFPSFVLRSGARPETEVTDPAEYSRRWHETRAHILAGRHDGPLYEQARWLQNRDNPVCA